MSSLKRTWDRETSPEIIQLFDNTVNKCENEAVILVVRERHLRQGQLFRHRTLPCWGVLSFSCAPWSGSSHRGCRRRGRRGRQPHHSGIAGCHIKYSSRV